jgi:DNA invertase Pin-like site-specific DNA recombinase
VRHFLEVLDTLNHLDIEFASFRENLDTGGPLGRAVIVIVSAVAEREQNLIVERVRAGLRRSARRTGIAEQTSGYPVIQAKPVCQAQRGPGSTWRDRGF